MNKEYKEKNFAEIINVFYVDLENNEIEKIEIKGEDIDNYSKMIEIFSHKAYKPPNYIEDGYRCKWLDHFTNIIENYLSLLRYPKGWQIHTIHLINQDNRQQICLNGSGGSYDYRKF